MDNVAEKSKKKGEEDWPIHYAALLEYYKEHETCNVSKKITYECDLQGIDEEGGSYQYKGCLGRWLNNQRSAKKGQGTSKLSSDHEEKLQSLVDEGYTNY